MKIERNPNGETKLTTYTPSIILIFETEAPDPVVSIPSDLNQVARIMAGIDPEWRELLERAVEEIDVG